MGGCAPDWIGTYSGRRILVPIPGEAPLPSALQPHFSSQYYTWSFSHPQMVFKASSPTSLTLHRSPPHTPSILYQHSKLITLGNILYGSLSLPSGWHRLRVIPFFPVLPLVSGIPLLPVFCSLLRPPFFLNLCVPTATLLSAPLLLLATPP